MRLAILTLLFIPQIVCSQSIIELGKNPDIGLDEIVVNLPNMPKSATPVNMVLVPAGSFVMGTPLDEKWRYSHELRQHEVTFTKAKYIGRYEVSQAQWKAVLGEEPIAEEWNGKGDNYPVYNVSWSDCQRFIEALNKLDLGTFRLPTEAEWEYCCRAGTTTRFWFGDALDCPTGTQVYEPLDKFLWWGGNNKPPYYRGTKPIGTKTHNAWGLFNIHGNIREFCSDYFRGPTTPLPETDPQGPPSGSNGRVIKGGAYDGYVEGCRSGFRAYVQYNNDRYDGNGLRLVREYDEKEGIGQWALY